MPQSSCRVRRGVLAGATLLAGALMTVAGAAASCEPGEPCAISGGTYRYHMPAGSADRQGLPVLVFVHGYRGSAEGVLANQTLIAEADRLGFLLVAADGENGSWSHVGSPSRARNLAHRDEIAFFEGLMTDLEARFAIDPERTLVVGFSQGGSMVWDLACFAPGLFDAYIAVAGAFWEPVRRACEGPVDLLHVHGLSDPVVPIEGRPIAGTFRQADVFASMSLLREAGSCPGTPTAFSSEPFGSCRHFAPCVQERRVQFCLHEGGHELPGAWFGPLWQWAQERFAQTR